MGTDWHNSWAPTGGPDWQHCIDGHCWVAQVGGTGGHRWVHCWVAPLGTGGRHCW
ncbi:unnamed protein product, partial [Staurois parvus]